MKVILLKSVQKVGKKDQIVEVADGYAVHSLFPKKLAIKATPLAISALTQKQRQNIEKIKSKHQELDKTIEKITKGNTEIRVKANENGVLFSRLTAKDIANYFKEEQKIEIDEKLIVIEHGAIKSVGKYVIEIVDEGYHSSFSIDIKK